MRAPLSVVALAAALCSCANAQTGTAATVSNLDKKLIEYGWDVPFPDYLRDNLREMEKRPFDGIIFKLRGGGKVLTPTAWDEAKFAQDFEILPTLEWQTFTDNFVIMWAASEQDWFSEQHWDAIEHNAKLIAKCARLARCKGVCFDLEPYGTNPWNYSKSPQRDVKSFAEYEAQVRQRGGQFMRAVESEFPGATMMTLFHLSVLSPMLSPMPPAQRASRLAERHYGLVPAFLNGMLEAASPEVEIIDGNEGAYYYTNSEQHLDAYHRMTQRALYLIDPSLWSKYRTQCRAGQALYVDQYFGLRTRKVLGHYLSPEERAKWFEHNVYHSLRTADKYVWCYSERMNWWTGKDIPAGADEAIRSARDKIASGAGLGFDMRPIVEAGQQRQQEEIASRLELQTAEIARLPDDVHPPAIDGQLDEVAWQATERLSPFVALASHPEELVGKTQAWVTYDSEALYIAFRCEEPKLEAITVVGHNRDDPIWEGDDVEIAIAAPGRTIPFHHFMLNPRGAWWDGLHHEITPDLGYNPEWQHAVRIGEEVWKAEVSLPWSALDMEAPKPGTKLRANLCRQRRQGPELSSWSPMANGFLEHKLFGTWVFR